MLYNYSDLVFKHFANPQNVGTLQLSDPQVREGVGGGLNHGTIIQLYLRIENFSSAEGANRKILEAKYKAQGCVAAIACGSWLTMQLMGKSLKEVEKITGNIIAEALKLPPEKFYCAMLTEIALCDAIRGLKND